MGIEPGPPKHGANALPLGYRAGWQVTIHVRYYIGMNIRPEQG